LAQPFFWDLIERILDEVLSELTGRSEEGVALSLECQSLSRTKNPTTTFYFPQTREKLLSNRSGYLLLKRKMAAGEWPPFSKYCLKERFLS